MKGIVALTGGTGFLGYHLVPALVAAGYEVRLLKRKGSSHPLVQAYPPQVQEVEADFANDQLLTQVLKNVSAVIHAAGLVSYDRKDQPLMQETHVELTRRLLAVAKRAGVKRFVHVSSIVTIGHGIEPRHEKSKYNADDLQLAYWTTKTEAEHLALEANAPGFEVLSVNPGSLLGRGEKNGQLLPFIKKLASSERPFLPDGGSDFLDVADAAKGTVLALERGRPGERYILGSENLTYAAFHKRLRALYGKASAPRLVPRWFLTFVTKVLGVFERLTGIDLPINAARLTRVNGVFMFHDISKARRELGYEPSSIDQALRHMLEEDRV